jgi:hypothetical protein
MILAPLLVNTWDKDADGTIQDVLDFTRDLSGQLVLFSAGPVAKVLVAKAWAANPKNIYLDVGAALDMWTKGKTTRHYTDPTHPSSQGGCLFKPRPADWLVPKKHLVYFCVFYNEKYVQLLRLALLGLKLWSDVRNLDIWIFADPSFTDKIYELGQELGLALRVVWGVDGSTLFKAASARFHIFEEAAVMGYESVLYLDTDILIRGDLAALFKEPIQTDKLYGVKEGTLGHSAFGGPLFRADGKPFDSAAMGLNSGILLFKPSKIIQGIFESTLREIQVWQAAGKREPPCLDQGFLCYSAMRAGCVDDSGLMNRYAVLMDDSYVSRRHETATLLHFSWPLGSFENKKQRMDDYLNYCLKYWHPRDQVVSSAMNWNQKSWKWNQGFIQLFSNGHVNTPWGQGEWEPIGERLFRAMWNGFSHTVRICEEDCCMLAVRAGDFLTVKTEKDHDLVNCDSITDWLQRKGFFKYEGNSEEVKKEQDDLRTFSSNTNVKRILEIGFNAGHSAELFLQANSEVKVVSFDLGEHAYGKAAKEYIDMKFPGRHEIIWGDSTKTVPAYQGEPFDLIFIDGGHTYAIALADLRNCAAFAKKDGTTMVVLDDTNRTSGWIHPVNTDIMNAWKKVLEEGLVKEDGYQDYTYARGITWGRYC